MTVAGRRFNISLVEEHGVHLSVPEIYEILAEKYVIRSKWKKNRPRGLVPRAIKPRQVAQMDAIDFGELFAFTAIDTFSQEADIFLATVLTAEYGCKFLYQSMRRRFNDHVDLLQTDGGPEFKAEFKSKAYSFYSRHRIVRPYRKNAQSYIESFNRMVRKECLGWQNYYLKGLSRVSEDSRNVSGTLSLSRASYETRNEDTTQKGG